MLACGLLAGIPAGPAVAQAVSTYRASYEIFYKGHRAGLSEFSVMQNTDDGTYRFVSNSRLRGIIAWFVAPRPIVENSSFHVEGGQLRPAAFFYEDGSRKGDDNYRIAFDWPAGAATLTTEDGPREIKLESGYFDRGSAQVATMLDAARGAVPGAYRIIDDDGLETYAVTKLGDARTTTGIGELATINFSQQRTGSSRRTILWMAPELRFLPVRIEQTRDGEAETVLVLESIEFD